MARTRIYKAEFGLGTGEYEYSRAKARIPDTKFEDVQARIRICTSMNTQLLLKLIVDAGEGLYTQPLTTIYTRRGIAMPFHPGPVQSGPFTKTVYTDKVAPNTVPRIQPNA